MLTNFAISNIVATVGVMSLPIIGRSWIAPRLSVPGKYYFFALTIWGVPFVLGQYCQENDWGSLWVQYHLLDLSYAPWGTALAMSLLSISAKLLRKEIAEKLLITSSLTATLAFGYVSEVWDSAWAWRSVGSLALAIDTNDYITITGGSIIAVTLYLILSSKYYRSHNELGA